MQRTARIDKAIGMHGRHACDGRSPHVRPRPARPRDVDFTVAVPFHDRRTTGETEGGMITIAENVSQNLTDDERTRVNQFSGAGGEKITVSGPAPGKTVVWHVTSGAHTGHTTIFYTQSGADYQIVGVGKHAGKKGGKTKYKAVWNGRGGHRVQVVIEKKGG
jgi:hypothetical protein